MLLIIGLGNPGKKFENTWHNLGFLVIDEFAKNNDFPDFRLDKRLNALVSRKENVILAKPQTFMNESGRSVLILNTKYEIQNTNLIVIHDDADLAIGTVKVSKNSGSAGHKGAQSIIDSLETKNFTRIRLGARPKNYIPGSKSLERFVLKKFSKTDQKITSEVIEKTTSAIEKIMLGEK